MAGPRIASLTHEQLQDPDAGERLDGGEPSLVQASHPQVPQRPQTSQGSDATRSVAPAIVDKGSANPLGAHKPEFGSVASQNLGSNPLDTYSGGTNVGILTGRPLAGGAVGLASAAALPVVGDVIGGVARDTYHETDHSPEAAERAQSRIRK